MKRIKVLHKISAGIGGIERFIFNNMEYINMSKFQFDFLTRNRGIVSTEEYNKYKFGIKYFSAADRYNKELFIDEINDILSEGYDAIHLHTTQWTGFLLEEIAMKKKIPKIIVHAHSTGGIIPLSSGELVSKEKLEEYDKLHKYYRDQFNQSLATHFCACSKDASNWLFGQQIPQNKIQIIKNAVDVDKYKFNTNVRKEIREEFCIEKCFVLGHVGRMSYEKNHEFLIDTFYKVYQRNDNARLLLIGGGPEENSIRKKVSNYGLNDVVFFLGWRNDVPRLLQAIDIFLLPSFFEGLGIAVIEAQAAGLRCICSGNVPSEVAITNNVEFISLDDEKWANKIFQLANEYERKDTTDIITAAGYNIKYEAKELEKLYEL